LTMSNLEQVTSMCRAELGDLPRDVVFMAVVAVIVELNATLSARLGPPPANINEMRRWIEQSENRASSNRASMQTLRLEFDSSVDDTSLSVARIFSSSAFGLLRSNGVPGSAALAEFINRIRQTSAK
jgi:hypothetical protein